MRSRFLIYRLIIECEYHQTLDLSNALSATPLENVRPKMYVRLAGRLCRTCLLGQSRGPTRPATPSIINCFMRIGPHTGHRSIHEMLIRHETCAYQSLTPFHHEMIGRNGMLVLTPSAARHPTIRNGHPAVLSTIRGDHSFQALPPRFPRLWRGFAKCTAGLGTAQLPNQDSSEAAPPSRLVGSFPMHLRNPFAKMPSISHCTYHPGSGQLQTYPCFWVVPECRACSCTKQLPLRVKGTSNDDPQGVSWSYYINTSKYIEPSCS
jgi:hypothetical protein